VVLSVPLGRLADRAGRAPVMLSGYGVLGITYLLLLALPAASFMAQLVVLFLFGLYYAATEGVLMAMVSTASPFVPNRRPGVVTTGQAWPR